MPQLSLYIQPKMLKQVETKARMEDVSISGWVSRQLYDVLQKRDVWPDNYFSLYGSLTDQTFVEPSELEYKTDVKRNNL
jgi:hypothetical protein